MACYEHSCNLQRLHLFSQSGSLGTAVIMAKLRRFSPDALKRFRIREPFLNQHIRFPTAIPKEPTKFTSDEGKTGRLT